MRLHLTRDGTTVTLHLSADAVAELGPLASFATMNPTRRILTLFATCVAWIPASVYLGRIAAQDQDAAGNGIYSAITTMFLLVLGGLSLGIPALLQARRYKQQIHICTHTAAWLILFSPVLVAGSVILFELIGDVFR